MKKQRGLFDQHSEVFYLGQDSNDAQVHV